MFNDNPIDFLVVTAQKKSLPCLQDAIRKAFISEVNITHRDTFHGGCEALLADSFDMVLVDLELPDQAGVSILSRFSLLSARAPLIALGKNCEMRAPSIRNLATDYINFSELKLEEWTAVLQAAWERHMIREQSRAPRIESALDRFERVAKEWGVANG